MSEKTYSNQQVSEAVNKACNDVADELGDGIVDVLNLMVNAALTYLDTPAADLEDVAELCYSESLDTVLSWCR